MKHKKKRLEYARQYQTISAKEWWIVVFSDGKKFNLDDSDGLQKYWHAQYFPEENFSTRNRISYDLVAFLSSRKLKLQFVSGRQKTAGNVKMQNDLSQAQEGCHLCREEWIFQQDNAAIHNASITKKYLLVQKIRLLDHPACSLDLNPVENLSGLIVSKVYEEGRQYLAISKLKNAILDAWEKYLRFNFRN